MLPEVEWIKLKQSTVPLLYGECLAMQRQFQGLYRVIHEEGTLEMIEYLSKLRNSVRRRCTELKEFYEREIPTKDGEILLKCWLLLESLLTPPSVSTVWKTVPKQKTAVSISRSLSKAGESSRQYETEASVRHTKKKISAVNNNQSQLLKHVPSQPNHKKIAPPNKVLKRPNVSNKPSKSISKPNRSTEEAPKYDEYTETVITIKMSREYYDRFMAQRRS